MFEIMDYAKSLPIRHLMLNTNGIKIAKDFEFVERLKTYAPDFWNDPKAAERVMKSIRVNKKWIKDYEKAQEQIEDLDVLFDFFREGEADADRWGQAHADGGAAGRARRRRRHRRWGGGRSPGGGSPDAAPTHPQPTRPLRPRPSATHAHVQPRPTLSTPVPPRPTMSTQVHPCPPMSNHIKSYPRISTDIHTHSSIATHIRPTPPTSARKMSAQSS